MQSLLLRAGIAAAALLYLDSPRAAMAVYSHRNAELSRDSTSQQYGKFLPPVDGLATPAEQDVLDTFLQKVRGPETSPSLMLATADEALAKLPAPTKLRGMIEYARAQAFQDLMRYLDAAEAAEQSAELLPGYSAPLIKAFSLNAYLNRTAPSSEYLMRAISVDPTTARTIDDYEIDNLLRRLQGFHDEARARAISDRLLQIGWTGDHVGSRSGLALEAIKLHIANGDVAGARALVPKLLVPADSRQLMIMNNFHEIWPDIEAWAGPRLERQWPIFLDEARERWQAGRTAIAARDYLSAMMAAGQYQVAIDELLPLFDAPAANDEDLIFLVAPLANALAHLGRWSDADALYERAQQTWPIGLRANTLNISANHALLLLEEGHADKAVDLMDASLADARRWGPEVGQTALSGMEHGRACMLHELGRDAEARVSMTQALAVEQGSAATILELCVGDPRAAKRALLDALENELIREDVLEFMQLPSQNADPSLYDRKQRAASDALRADPELRQAVVKYGRILPWRMNEMASITSPAARTSMQASAQSR